MDEYASNDVWTLCEWKIYCLVAVKNLVNTFFRASTLCGHIGVGLMMLLQVMQEELGGKQIIVRETDIHPETFKHDTEETAIFCQSR